MVYTVGEIFVSYNSKLKSSVFSVCIVTCNIFSNTTYVGGNFILNRSQSFKWQSGYSAAFYLLPFC